MGGTVARHEYALDAGGVGDAQAGAEVARVGHAVKDQDERVVGNQVEQFIELELGLLFLGHRNDALVRNVGSHAVKATVVGGHHAHAGGDQLLAHLAHALVAAFGIKVDGGDGLRVHAQTGAHGMEACQNNVLHLQQLLLKARCRANQQRAGVLKFALIVAHDVSSVSSKRAQSSQSSSPSWPNSSSKSSSSMSNGSNLRP